MITRLCRRPIRCFVIGIALLSVVAVQLRAENPSAAAGDNESLFFTSQGFSVPGKPVTAQGPETGELQIAVRDADSKQITGCRISVVGPDGNYYQPAANPLSKYSMTGVWPKEGAWGNRPGKAPYRYLGHYFYSSGESAVRVPAGKVRIEIWKGFEYEPLVAEAVVDAGQTVEVASELRRTVPMAREGYFGGDLHLHFARPSEDEDTVLFQLLDAEDVWYGTPLAYNEPAGPYQGVMADMDSPQHLGLGENSIRKRGHLQMLSGQEYRSVHFGHLNLYGLPRLVFESQSFNLDDGPAYGIVGAEAISQGATAIHAHGGYAKEVWADAALGTVSAVELLQFGIYREMGLAGWYDILNTGYRFPCVGASDFPACRFMSDCRTYVRPDAMPGQERSLTGKGPDIRDWIRCAAEGRSFVTTGPLLLFDVDGKHPGEILKQQGTMPKPLQLRLRARCEVTPITTLQLIVNGEVVKESQVAREAGEGEWIELQHTYTPSESCWIAARVWSTSSGGEPDAEAHTNPVYFEWNDRRCYRQSSLDAWLQKIDGQLALHAKRDFKGKAAVLAYFQRARDVLVAIRARGGLKSAEVPWQLVEGRGSSHPVLDDKLLERIGQPDVTDEELRAFLRPVPPRPAKETLNDFEVAPGFRLDLVAAEPLVRDPVAACFDENGQLYVCEMRDYPFKPQEGGKPVGSVRLLRDVDGDGTFDEASLFADELLWAAGVVPWKGGVFVAAAPDIWYLKDTDGDFRADVRRRVFTGFGTGNQQAMVNNLQFGFDQWIYGTTAGNGGTITRVDDPDFLPVPVTGRDFRFDPVTEKFEAITGTVQFGNTFDDWGNRFTCSESQPLQHIVQPDHYLARNPFLAAPRGIQNLAPGPIPIYRISPVERWRQIRSLRRIAKNERAATSAGASHHVIDAAAGATVYRGGAFPPEYRGQVFIGDGQNNLVHRRSLTPQGVTFTSARVDNQTEFLRSPDIWFRPVNFVNAPDGTLYCLDMCREVLESIHIPLDVARHLDFASGRDHGRIFRIAPRDFQSPPPPRLAGASTRELVKHLESPHGWWRDTAQRLLIERQDTSVGGPLRALAVSASQPQTRIHALWCLHGLKILDPPTLLQTLRDSHPRVVEHAVRLSEPSLNLHHEIVSAVVSRGDDTDARVRYQIAFSLGECQHEAALPALLGIAQRDGADPWMRTALLSSAVPHAGELFVKLSLQPGDFQAFLGSLAGLVGTRNQSRELKQVLTALAERSAGKAPMSLDPLLLPLGRGVKSRGGTLGEVDSPAVGRWLEAQRSLARATALDSTKDEAARVAAIEVLGFLTYPERLDDLLGLVNPTQPDSIQSAAVRALDGDAMAVGDAVADRLLASWSSLTPAVRATALEFMLAQPARTRRLLESVLAGEFTLAELSPIQREALQKHRDGEIRDRARRIFGSTENQPRGVVVAKYQAALELQGNPSAGAGHFEKNCAACHQLQGKGHAVGPNLASSSAKDPQALLTHILDPNQYVLPNYVQYLVTDARGRTHSGVLAGQTATSVILRQDQGKSVILLRNEIDEIASTGKSLMPEEFEKALSLQQMADLLAYLQQATERGDEESLAERDFGTLPGLIEPPGR